MDLQPIKTTYFEAHEKLREYGSILKERRTAEDLAVIRSYKAIAKGMQVIDLSATIAKGGRDQLGFPRVAVARADDPWLHCQAWNMRARFCGMTHRGEWLAPRTVDRRLRQGNPRAFEVSVPGNSMSRSEAQAIVPSIPPALRPAPSALDRLYILFEAKWEPVAPADPALLMPLGRGMFAVVAVWDLTAVERGVLADQRGV